MNARMCERRLRFGQARPGGALCKRVVSGEWACVGCGAPACGHQRRSVILGKWDDRAACRR